MGVDALLAALLKYAAVGAAAVGVAAFVARTWLQTQFSKQLEQFRAAQQGELESLRYRINSYLDRAVRLHQMEFEVLPELWGKLHESFYSTQRFISWVQMHHDLNKMGEDELELILEGSTLHPFQKDQVRNASDKTKRYYEIEFWHELKRINEYYYDFTGYLMRKSIFLPVELQEQFYEMRDTIFAAIREKQFHQSYKTGQDLTKTEKRDHFEKRGLELMKELEQTVREHLQDSRRQFLEA